MEKNEITNLFARLVRKDEKLTEKERQIKGAKKFKRKVLGLCGTKSVKTLDEMAQTLCKTGIVCSAEEGKEITPLFVGEKVRYDLFNEIGFYKFKDKKGNQKYKIQVHSYYEGL